MSVHFCDICGVNTTGDQYISYRIEAESYYEDLRVSELQLEFLTVCKDCDRERNVSHSIRVAVASLLNLKNSIKSYRSEFFSDLYRNHPS